MTMSDDKPIRTVPRWFIWIVYLVMAASAIVGTIAVYGVVQSEHDLATVAQESHATIVQLSKNNDALRLQVQRLGQKPVAPSAAQVIAQAGKNGENGTNGTNGQNGRSVLSVSCESDGSWIVAYDDGTTSTAGGSCIGQTGATGATGPSGASGTNGANGADGQPPTSWSFTDDHNVAYTCTRTDPFDPAQPTYTCARD